MESLSSRVQRHYDAVHKTGDAQMVARRNLDEAIASGNVDNITAASIAMADLPVPDGQLPSLVSFVETFKSKGKLTATQENDARARILVDAGYARGVNGTLSMSWFKTERAIARDTLVGIDRLYSVIFAK